MHIFLSYNGFIKSSRIVVTLPKKLPWREEAKLTVQNVCTPSITQPKLDNTTQKCIELNEYMLNVIDGFLSGGDYLPHRQIFQKTSLLLGLIRDNAKVGNKEKALSYMKMLYKTCKDYFDFLDHPNNKHCLMFVEGDTDGYCDSTKDDINERVAMAEKILEKYQV